MLEKQQRIKDLFKSCHSAEDRYLKIIELGKNLEPMPSDEKTPENIVPGCQSIVYLSSRLVDGKIYFAASSEALISAGLAALLILSYNGESPESLFKHPPAFLNELGILASLSPGRSNGVASMYLRMQKAAIAFTNS